MYDVCDMGLCLQGVLCIALFHLLSMSLLVFCISFELQLSLLFKITSALFFLVVN